MYIQTTEIEKRLIFIISIPRSGSTMLQRVLASHSEIMTIPEPFIITPLAYMLNSELSGKKLRGVSSMFINKILGYDYQNTLRSIMNFVDCMPRGKDDFVVACRAFCNVMYSKMVENAGKKYFIDKSPYYALILPFLVDLYPDAKYILLVRDPIAIQSSNAEFAGNKNILALEHKNILEIFIPVLARFWRDEKVAKLLVRYEDFVTNPAKKIEDICRFLGVRNEEGMVEFGKQKHIHTEGIGDVKIHTHNKPVTNSIKRWESKITGNRHNIKVMKKVVEKLDEDDIRILGYDKSLLVKRLVELEAETPKICIPNASAIYNQFSFVVRRTLRSGMLKWLMKEIDEVKKRAS